MALIDKHYRFFVRHFLSFRPHNKKAAPLELVADGEEIDVRTLIQAAIKKDTAKFEVRINDEVRLTKLDVREKDNIAIFLSVGVTRPPQRKFLNTEGRESCGRSKSAKMSIQPFRPIYSCN